MHFRKVVSNVKRSYVSNGLCLYQTAKFWTCLSKWKAFTDNRINVTKKLEFVLGREESIVGKGENVGYHNVFRSRDGVVKSSPITTKCLLLTH